MGTKSYIDYTSEIYIYYVDMPYSMDSNLVENPDGSFTLYLNSRMTHEKNVEGYLHEVKHVNNDDFEGTSDIHDVENEARKD